MLADWLVGRAAALGLVVEVTLSADPPCPLLLPGRLIQ
ncbi:hypothetical protein BOO71_0014833 [Deinococcus marmoris]|uniref:Uncharacterized protein n=1 Tax=Deinococcus marmoris TaxID=249408 RepID=A0A1U7NRB4_9DEIO|nr:hypothetical protein BOO71_0014833 [Deinococcus marmoris]